MRLAELLDDDQALHANLRLVIGKYRTYERDTASAGASTPTTAAGGASTPTSSASASHRHRMFDQGGGTALGLAHKTITAWNETTGTAIVLDMATNASFLDTKSAAGSHDHTVGVAAHQHSVDVPGHAHAQVYDIFEDSSYPGPVSLEVDQVNVDSIIGGPLQASAGNNTFDVSLTGIITSPGWHRLRVSTASGRGRCTPYIIAKTLQLQ